MLERGRASPAGEGSIELAGSNEHQDWQEDWLVSADSIVCHNCPSTVDFHYGELAS